MLLFTHIMYYKVDLKYVLCYQRGSLQKLKCAGNLISKRPQEQLQFAFKGSATATEMCK